MILNILSAVLLATAPVKVGAGLPPAMPADSVHVDSGHVAVDSTKTPPMKKKHHSRHKRSPVALSSQKKQPTLISDFSKTTVKDGK